MTSRLAILPLLLVLAACDQAEEPAPKAGEAATAEGEVLGGTISDDMLPLDSLTSTSPPMASDPEEAGESGDGETSAPALAAEPAPEPAPEPAEPAPAAETE